MALINPKKKEVQVKIVYYGPGRGGKTTNLEYINKKFKKRIQNEMVTVKTYGDRTLFFDFLPFDIGEIKGHSIKAQLYTVPGQVKYNATRRLVLRGVDGLVFVADSMDLRREMNIRSLQNLKENLETFNVETVIKVASIDTENEKRDDHLRSADFFDTEKSKPKSWKDIQGKSAMLHEVLRMYAKMFESYHSLQKQSLTKVCSSLPSLNISSRIW